MTEQSASELYLKAPSEGGQLIETSVFLPDFEGENYLRVLERFHNVLNPETYFEIGTQAGHTLALSRCPSISVDPRYEIRDPVIMKRICDKSAAMLFSMTSDGFFARYDPKVLFKREIDFAFLDGMHRCEFLLRDFVNTEKASKRNSVIFLHDCLPLDAHMADRTQDGHPPTMPSRQGWWTGDVWKTALFLKRYRTDLSITCLDAQRTGLVIITNLNPDHTSQNNWDYLKAIRIMSGFNLTEMGLPTLFSELEVQSTLNFETHEQVTLNFWL